MVKDVVLKHRENSAGTKNAFHFLDGGKGVIKANQALRAPNEIECAVCKWKVISVGFVQISFATGVLQPSARGRQVLDVQVNAINPTLGAQAIGKHLRIESVAAWGVENS